MDLKEIREKYPNLSLWEDDDIFTKNNFKYTFDKCPIPECQTMIPIKHSDNMSVYKKIGYVYMCYRHAPRNKYISIDNKTYRTSNYYGAKYESGVIKLYYELKTPLENRLHLVRLKRRPFYKLYKYWHRLKRTLIWYLVYKHIADGGWAECGRFVLNRKKKQGVYYKKDSDIKRAFERAKYDRNGLDLFTFNFY